MPEILKKDNLTENLKTMFSIEDEDKLVLSKELIGGDTLIVDDLVKNTSEKFNSLL